MNRHAWLLGPGIVGLITASSLTGAALLIYHAHSDPSFAVEEDYYDRAVHWDDAAAQERRNAELGWRVDADLDRAGRVRLSLADGDGDPIEGAAATVQMFHGGRAADRQVVAMEPVGEGVYEGVGAVDREGLWELRLVASRGDEKFTAVVQCVVASGARGEEAGR